MRCTIPELNESSTKDEMEDTIIEMWKVLDMVEALRYWEKEAIKMRYRMKPDADKLAEAQDTIYELRKGIDEWFRTLREGE